MVIVVWSLTWISAVPFTTSWTSGRQSPTPVPRLKHISIATVIIFRIFIDLIFASKKKSLATSVADCHGLSALGSSSFASPDFSGFAFIGR
jgi:hypothetical protein